MKYDIRQAAQALISQLKAIDYERLPISKYNKRYIARLKPVLSYYMKIYADCLLKGLESIGSSPEEITLIDYGGGSGFLSILAKQAGIGRVIYIDLNPDSINTIRILKELVNTGPDIILHGDSDTLADWCSANKVKPQLLIATDLIEHVYDLSAFFANLVAIDNKMQMLFTTASTPFNPYVKRRLHRLMTIWEKEYYALRLHYIQLHFPALSPAEAKEAARLAEEKRIADEAAARAADVEHRRAINASAVQALIDQGIPDDWAKACVVAIARGKVPATTINY